MKKILSVLLAVVLTCALLSCAFAEQEEPERISVGDWEYVVLDNESVEITHYRGDDTEMLIPEELDGKTVTSIESEAFRRSISDPVSITIPKTIKTIRENAFWPF